MQVKNVLREGSSEDPERSEGRQDGQQMTSVAVSNSGTTPRPSRIPRPSVSSLTTTPGLLESAPPSQGPSPGSPVRLGGKSRIPRFTGRPSMGRQLSADSGDTERAITTTQKRPQPSNCLYTKTNPARRPHTRPKLQRSSDANTNVLRSSRLPQGQEQKRASFASSDTSQRRQISASLNAHRMRSRAKKPHRNCQPQLPSVLRPTTHPGRNTPSVSSRVVNRPETRVDSALRNPERQSATIDLRESKRQKSCDAGTEVLRMSRAPQGQPSARCPGQQQKRVTFASPDTSHRLQLSASLNAHRMRSRAKKPHTNRQPNTPGILRPTIHPGGNIPSVYSSVFDRSETWVYSTLLDPKRQSATIDLRDPKNRNSISIAERELESRPLEEILAALPSPSKVGACVDHGDLDVLPGDPELYSKMEMLYEMYREKELLNSLSIADSQQESRPLEELLSVLPTPSKLSSSIDADNLDILLGDAELYSKMETLFEKYREEELRAE